MMPITGCSVATSSPLFPNVAVLAARAVEGNLSRPSAITRLRPLWVLFVPGFRWPLSPADLVPPSAGASALAQIIAIRRIECIVEFVDDWLSGRDFDARDLFVGNA